MGPHERRLEGQVRATPSWTLKDGLEILVFILRAVWGATGSFKQECDQMRFVFGNISQADGMHINCAIREDKFLLEGALLLGSQTPHCRPGFQLTKATQGTWQTVRAPTQVFRCLPEPCRL